MYQLVCPSRQEFVAESNQRGVLANLKLTTGIPVGSVRSCGAVAVNPRRITVSAMIELPEMLGGVLIR